MFYNAAHLLGTLLVNAIPLIGVIWFGWNVFEVLFLYWFENVAIGVAHAARLAISTRTNAVAKGWETTTFFMMHYGIFTAVHGIFVVAFFGVVAGGLAQINPGFMAPVAAIMAWQAVFLLLDSTRSEGFKGRTPDDMMFEPYPRVFALHITVIAGGWLIGEVGSPVWALAILVVVKSAFDFAMAWIATAKTPQIGGIFAALRKTRD